MTSEELCFDDVEVGTELPVLAKTPTPRQLVMYAGASGDFYEVHYDRDFARDRGLPGVIVHGALKSGFLCQMLTDWAGYGGTIRRLSVRYRGMDLAGATLYCKGAVSGKRVVDGEGIVECDVWTENGGGERTTVGSAAVALPFRE